jgi:hypothetical protein
VDKGTVEGGERGVVEKLEEEALTLEPEGDEEVDF